MNILIKQAFFFITIIGWGALHYQGPVSPVLNKVSVPVWSNSDCNDAYEQPIRDAMICAGNPQGGQDSCQVRKAGLVCRLLLGKVTFTNNMRFIFP